jgi:hypothetical protein
MKLVAEKIAKNTELQEISNATDQIKVILTTLLTHNIENKIDWDVKTIDKNQTSFIASIHVMNNAEWSAAKKILKEITSKFPDSKDDVHRFLGIVDPLGNFDF